MQELAKAGGRISGTSAAKKFYENLSMVSLQKQAEKLDQICQEMRSIWKNEQHRAEIAELKKELQI